MAGIKPALRGELYTSNTGYPLSINSLIDYRNVCVKRRKIVCGTDRDGTGGCGHMWFTIEVPDVAVG